MKTTMKTVLGSLRRLGQRVRDVGQPGLGVWVFGGEQAAREVSREIVDRAHRNECSERDAASQIEGILADGRISAPELRRLQQMPGALRACAERSHDITEAAAL